MKEKVEAQIHVAELVRAVDQRGVVEGAMIGEYYDSTVPHEVIFLGDCEVYENISTVALYEDYIKKAVSYADKNTEIGLITFGYNSEYELPLTNSPAFSSFGTAPDGNYTDIYSAVIKAAAMMPADAAKRIIILTDGKENIGRIREGSTPSSTRRAPRRGRSS